MAKAGWARRARCVRRPRFDDAFAFGAPEAMDAYAAPYHPYATECCEEYVTATLPLLGLVEVGVFDKEKQVETEREKKREI